MHKEVSRLRLAPLAFALLTAAANADCLRTEYRVNGPGQYGSEAEDTLCTEDACSLTGAIFAASSDAGECADTARVERTIALEDDQTYDLDLGTYGSRLKFGATALPMFDKGTFRVKGNASIIRNIASRANVGSRRPNRLMAVGRDASVSLENLTLSDGTADPDDDRADDGLTRFPGRDQGHGPAVFNNGILRLSNVTTRNNRSSSGGSRRGFTYSHGIFSAPQSELYIADSRIGDGLGLEGFTRIRDTRFETARIEIGPKARPTGNSSDDPNGVFGTVIERSILTRVTEVLAQSSVDFADTSFEEEDPNRGGYGYFAIAVRQEPVVRGVYLRPQFSEEAQRPVTIRFNRSSMTNARYIEGAIRLPTAEDARDVELVINNSTFAGLIPSDYITGEESAILSCYRPNVRISLSSVTIAGNGRGIPLLIDACELRMKDTIVQHDDGDACVFSEGRASVEAINSYTSDGSCNTPALDDPMLGPLANFGTLTWYREPEPGSPLIDAGSPPRAGQQDLRCQDPDFTGDCRIIGRSEDQRGVIRNGHGASTDIGAIEALVARGSDSR